MSNPVAVKAEQARRLEEAKIESAWQSLAANKDFQFILDHDLQRKFSFLGSVFRQDDGYNSTGAAVRDGQRSVVSYLLKRVKRTNDADDGDEKTSTKKRKSAI